MTARPVFDVFLSHRVQDAGLAQFATDELRKAGLEVFHEGVMSPTTEPVIDSLRKTLAESAAIVLLVTPGYAASSNLAFLAGAAMAWSKPIYVLFDGMELRELPSFLGQFEVASLTEVARVAENIRRGLVPLDSNQQEALKAAFSATGVSVDRLLLSPNKMRELSRHFHDTSGVMVGAERLVRELLNMRKRGDLPRLSMRGVAG